MCLQPAIRSTSPTPQVPGPIRDSILITDGILITSQLTSGQEAEVLAWLAARPLRTFGMAGFIRANGLESPHNRGHFYACRDRAGRLQGVALIGHATMFEARHPAALAAFARLAQGCPDVRLILGEAHEIKSFCSTYFCGRIAPRLRCRELLLELRWPVQVEAAAPGLRQAVAADLSLVMPVQAEMALAESGVNPLDVDPAGFRERCRRRIERGLTWVWVEEGRLIFKAEIVADTPEVAYLEGVWVAPEARGQGLGRRCLSQLSRSLLRRAGAVCLLVNEDYRDAQTFYQKAGFRFQAYFESVFL